MRRSIGLFMLAASAEIGGAWLVWHSVLAHSLPDRCGGDHVRPPRQPLSHLTFNPG
jgi:hypothetical protein